MTTNRFITRNEIVSEIGRWAYDNAVKYGKLTPVKFGERSNCKVRVDKCEYEKFIQFSKENY